MPTAATTSTKFVVPIIADMDASGAATLGVIQQETVAITGIHYEYDVSLNEVDSAKLLNAFKVHGRGPTAADADGGFYVELLNSTDLKALLAAGIDGSNAAADLRAFAKASIESAINSDNLINTVEDATINVTSFTVDASGAAVDMDSKLKAEQDATNTIYTQIPSSTLNLYMDADEGATTDALPMKPRDTLTFVFDCTPTVTVSKTLTQDSSVYGDPVTGAYAPALNAAVENRRLAFNFIVNAPGKDSFKVAAANPAPAGELRAVA